MAALSPAASVGALPTAGTAPAGGMAQTPSTLPTTGGSMPSLAILFGYQPSFIMAFIGAVFFSIALFIHSYQIFKYKTKYFGLLPQAALLAAVSACARVSIISNEKLLTAFSVITLGGQALGSITSIGIFFTFTRILWWVTPNEKRTWNAAWAPVGAITFQWGLLSALCDVTKTVGMTFLPPDPQTKHQGVLGRNVQAVGSVLQIFVFGAFTIMAARFHRMARRWEARDLMAGVPGHWKQLSQATIASAALITIRQTYLTIVLDQKQVQMSYATSQEWVFWFFDQLPLLVIFFTFIVYHPGKYFPREYTGFRLNRKNLLALKEQSLEAGAKNGYIISSPKLTRSIEEKPTWSEVETREIQPETYGTAK